MISSACLYPHWILLQNSLLPRLQYCGSESQSTHPPAPSPAAPLTPPLNQCQPPHMPWLQPFRVVMSFCTESPLSSLAYLLSGRPPPFDLLLSFFQQVFSFFTDLYTFTLYERFEKSFRRFVILATLAYNLSSHDLTSSSSLSSLFHTHIHTLKPKFPKRRIAFS